MNHTHDRFKQLAGLTDSSHSLADKKRMAYRKGGRSRHADGEQPKKMLGRIGIRDAMSKGEPGTKHSMLSAIKKSSVPMKREEHNIGEIAGKIKSGAEDVGHKIKSGAEDVGHKIKGGFEDAGRKLREIFHFEEGGSTTPKKQGHWKKLYSDIHKNNIAKYGKEGAEKRSLLAFPMAEKPSLMAAPKLKKGGCAKRSRHAMGGAGKIRKDQYK